MAFMARKVSSSFVAQLRICNAIRGYHHTYLMGRASSRILEPSSRVFMNNFSRSITGGIIPETKITFSPENAEVLVPPPGSTILTEADKKAEMVDLSNFMVTSEATPEQLAMIGKSLAIGIGPSDLSICWWLPTGGVYYIITYFHDLGLPWWSSIAIFVIIARVLLTKLVVKTQIKSAEFSKVQPLMQDAQERITKARAHGNDYEEAMAQNDLARCMQKTNKGIFSTFGTMAFQAPIFISTFIVLRKMTDYPVESMKTGGTLWFTDLTAADPYFLLPVITAGTMHLILRFGIDLDVSATMGKVSKNLALYGLPAAMLGVFAWGQFPAALLCYWTTTNFVSLIQGAILRQPKVKKYFGIPDKLVMPKKETPKKPSRGLVNDIKDKWSNIKQNMYQARKLGEMRQIQAQQFKKAAHGPITPTFKYDPTKVAK